MLIDEIIDSLSDETSSLNGVLLKTQRLLHNLGRKDLAEWVKWELNGYPDNSDIPEYRILPASVMANLSNGFTQFNNHPLPLNHLTEDTLEKLQTARFSQSLAVLQGYADGADGTEIFKPIPLEFNGSLGKSLASGYVIQRAWSSISKESLKGIPTQIRSRLLDFLLDLKDSLGNSDTLAAKEKASEPSTSGSFQNAIFGDNTTVIVGGSHHQLMQLAGIKNNVAELTKTLSKIGIPDEILAELKAAIASDVNLLGNAAFEGDTGRWYTGLLGRAAKGAINVSVDVISSTVAKVLAAFMGAPIS